MQSSDKQLTKATTIKEVAKHAKVSIKTVSRVLNQEPTVAEATRQRVLKAVAELQYVPNVAARALKSAKSYNIALVYSNPSPNYIYSIINGATEACSNTQYKIVLHSCDYYDKQLAADLLAMIKNNQVDSFILTPPISNQASLIAKLEQNSVIYSAIAATQLKTTLPTIHNNEYQSAFNITQYLIDIGHRDIGFIFGHKDHSGSRQRWLGFKDAMFKNQLKIVDNWIALGDFSFQSGLVCANKILKANAPTAIFASNDDMAAAVISVARQRNIAIPNDLAIVGFDDTDIASAVWPRLTTIKQNDSYLAKLAVKQCIDALNGRDSQNFTPIVGQIVQRESTGHKC